MALITRLIALKRAGVETNGIRECKVLPKTGTGPNFFLLTASSACSALSIVPSTFSVV
jgi:hypothetical protein